jgi:DNA gyrase subunit B
MHVNFSAPLELHDCKEHGPGSGAELFVVEGDSAAKSVSRLRNLQSQAVIPMQGKPLNAFKAKREAVLRNSLLSELLRAIGCQDFVVPDKPRYEKIILLFDPDADGIHCGALMTLFFYRWLRPIMDSGRLYLVRAPLFEIANQQRDKIELAYTEEQYRQMCEQLVVPDSFKKQRYRGLGSMNDDVLYRACINPETRKLYRLTAQDAEASAAIFGGNKTNLPRN